MTTSYDPRARALGFAIGVAVAPSIGCVEMHTPPPPMPDAATVVDASAPPDAPTEEVDAYVVADAGLPEVDSGALEEDAGADGGCLYPGCVRG
jgi:hypothetical protein